MDQFECPPRPAPGLGHHSSGGGVDFGTAGDGDDNGPDRRPAAATAKWISQLVPNGQRRPAQIWLPKGHYLADEFMELTCAFELADELDVELAGVEWRQLEWPPGASQGNRSLAAASGRLIWRSREVAPRAAPPITATATATSNNISATRQLADDAKLLRTSAGVKLDNGANGASQARREPPGGGANFAIIDYVTRANERDADRALKLLRVVHLIWPPESFGPAPADGGRVEQLFACRLTNSAGQLDLLQAVQIDHLAGPEARAASRRRQAARRRLTAGSELASVALRRLEGAEPKAAQRLAEELALRSGDSSPDDDDDDDDKDQQDELDDDEQQPDRRHRLDHHQQRQRRRRRRPLFVPIHLVPSELLAAPSSSLSPPPSAAFSSSPKVVGDDDQTLAAGSLARSPLQRPGPRQTDATTTTMTSLAPKAGSWNHWGGKGPPRRSLREVALEVIGRFTISQAWAQPDGREAEEHLEEEEEEKEGGEAGAMDNRTVAALLGAIWRRDELPLGAKLRSACRLLKARFFDKWSLGLAADVPLLLGVLGGLLAGCLLSFLVLLRVRCLSAGPSIGRRRRKRCVADVDSAAREKLAKAVGEDGEESNCEEVDGGDDDDDDDDDDDGDDGDGDHETDEDDDDDGDNDQDHGDLLELGRKQRGHNLQQTSGGSSSSTTNGSERRLIGSTNDPGLGKAAAGRQALDYQRLVADFSPSCTTTTNSDEQPSEAQVRSCSLQRRPPPGRHLFGGHQTVGRPAGSLSRRRMGPGTGAHRRLIVVAPSEHSQQELRELSLAPYFEQQIGSFASNHLHHQHAHYLGQEQFGGGQLNLSDGPGAQQGPLAGPSDLLNIGPNGNHLATEQWPAARALASCEDRTESTSSLLLTSNCQQTTSGHYLVTGPPKLRSLTQAGEICLLPAAYLGDQLALEQTNYSLGGNFEAPPTIYYHQQPAGLIHCSSSITSPGITSSASSSATAAQTPFNQRRQVAPELDLLPELDDALRLLEASVGSAR